MEPTTTPTVVLVSLDGYRFQYLVDEAFTEYRPTLTRLAGEGVYGSLQPVFPSDTFPNHYSIVTGLLPEA